MRLIFFLMKKWCQISYIFKTLSYDFHDNRNRDRRFLECTKNGVNHDQEHRYDSV